MKFALTINPNKTDRVYYARDFGPIIKKLEEAGIKVDRLKWEVKSKTKVLHWHGLAEASYVDYKGVQTEGWQCYFKKINNLVGWLAYCTKDIMQDHPDNVLNEHWYINNYGFI